MEISVLGTGMIATEMLSAIEVLDNVRCTGLLYRQHSQEKAEALKREHHIEHITTDYEELLRPDAAPVVYIALPNSVHYEYALRALQAGKHVIVEKPMCTTFRDARVLAEEARSRHLHLIEAVTLLHHPNFNFIKQQLKNIGKPRLAVCNYSQRSSRYDRYLQHILTPVFMPELAGGALYDLNIYNINFIVGLFGLPTSAHYFPNRGWNGIDTSGCLVLRYPDFTATCIAAKDADGENGGVIEGDAGRIVVSGPVSTLTEVRHINAQKEIKKGESINAHRLTIEMRDIAAIIDGDDYARSEACLCQSLNVMQTVDMALSAQRP